MSLMSPYVRPYIARSQAVALLKWAIACADSQNENVRLALKRIQEAVDE